MFIKRPGAHGRVTYAIVDDNGKTLKKDSRVIAINKDLKAGVAKDILEVRIMAVLRDLKPKAQKTPISVINEKAVFELHRKKVRVNPQLVDPDSLRSRMLSAAAYLGDLTLQETSEDDLYEKLDIEEFKTNHPRRFEVYRAVNEMLVYYKRGFTLYNPRPDRPDEITYIRIADFLAKTKTIDPTYAIVLGALFASGCRFGELSEAEFGPESVYVARQLRRDGRVGQTKNKQARVSPLIPPLLSFIRAYSALSREVRRNLRLKHYYRLYGACTRCLGISLHDLRHSYAVEWGAVGSRPDEIARYIGDTLAVSVKHYQNYCATPDEVALAVKRWVKG